MISKNLNTSGRLLRLAIALLLLGLAWWYASWLLLLFSLFTFFEAFMSWCVVYQLLGINSCPIEQRKKKE